MNLFIYFFELHSTKKHKEDWIKAFRKVPNLRIIETKDLKEIEKIRQIGVGFKEQILIEKRCKTFYLCFN